VNTRRGLYVSLAVQEGFNIGGYGYRYLRVLPEVRGFLPLGESLVVAARVRVGGLVPVSEDGEPPIIARFFAGGPLSMRGYYTRRLSPMVREEGEWIPVGGNGLLDTSLELRWSVGGSWGAVVFLDGASVAPPSARPTSYLDALRDVQFASGLGVRYATPFGPVRLDVGVRLPSELGGGVPFDRRFPTVPPYREELYGVHREPIAAVQFSIGEAF
jgi:translocation and assembly module TamA